MSIGAGRATPPNPLAGGSASSIHTFPLPPPGPPQTRGKSRGGGVGVVQSKREWGPDLGEFIMEMSPRRDWGARACRLHSSRLTLVKAPRLDLPEAGPRAARSSEHGSPRGGPSPETGAGLRPAFSCCWLQPQVLRPL